MKEKHLTQEQLDFYKENGFLVIPNMLTQDEVLFLRNYFLEGFEKELWKKNPLSATDNIKDLYREFPQIIPIVFKPKYIEILKELLGNDLYCLPESVVHKNRFFDWHKDTTTMSYMTKTDFSTHKAVLLQCGYYLQNNTPEGGGITILPKTNIEKDRFVNMHFGNIFHRTYYKILKILKISPFDNIEKSKKPYDIPSKAGDLLVFNNKIDHRATFLRTPNGKPKPTKEIKLAIFNTFGNDKNYTFQYYKSLAFPNEPYSNFLKTDILPNDLKVLEGKLNFEFCYKK
ncbi:MAG: hypothetical protein EAZ27_07855 [Cytophagales bacterium]|nr:MAG: hypothetical protein EAZ27_07855 [Cytophagales bacterium]